MGVEAIVVLLHEGGAQAGYYDQCEGISGPIVDIATNLSDAVDVVVSGHTHRPTTASSPARS
jgi:5'-nucleotidase